MAKRLRSTVSRDTAPCEAGRCLHLAQYELDGRLLCGLCSLHAQTRRHRLSEQDWVEQERPRLQHWLRESGAVCYRQMGRLDVVPRAEDASVCHVFVAFSCSPANQGFHCSVLAPQHLGPVPHRQPGLPDAPRLETYWRFGQCWPGELDDEGVPRATFFERRRSAYDDWRTTPYHKFGAKRTQRERALVGQVNPWAARLFVHQALDGQERFYSHVEARYFFCCAYERLVWQQEAFHELLARRASGIDLVLFGVANAFHESLPLHECYASTTQEFDYGHALLAMLTVAHPAQYPWHQYRRCHEARYEGVAHCLTEYHAVA